MKLGVIPKKKIGLIFVFVFTFASAQNAQMKGGRWMFENNGIDESTWDSVKNNGTISGAAIFGNISPVAQGSYYLSLEDSADFGVITVPDQEELDFHNENLAVSLWAYPVEGYDNPQYLFMKGDRSGSVKFNNYAIRINSGYVEFIVHAESGAKKVARSSFGVVKNEWNFIGAFYDYVNSKLYLWNNADSEPIDTFDFNAPLFPNGNKLYIGTSGENGYKRFWGRIDDLRISNEVFDVMDNTTNIELSDTNSYLTKLLLNQNYPNPFNPETILKFSLAKRGFTELNVYNIIGKHVVSLVNSDLPAGEHTIHFNAADLPSGVYIYQLQQDGFSELKKMMLIK